MEVTWDEEKNKKNFKKHGIWFEEALTIFFDPLARTSSDDHPHEQRWITLGSSMHYRILLVVHLENEESEIRIISARKLTLREQKNYEEGI